MDVLYVAAAATVAACSAFGLFMCFADADLTLLWYHLFCSKKKREYKNKVIWITGASSGIGEHLAYSLAKCRAKLILSGVNVERLNNVKRLCVENAGYSDDNVLLLPFLINNFDEHESCVKKALHHFGHIDALVNNAGLSQRADFQTIDIDVDQHLFNINVFGAVNLSRIVLKHFLDRKEGQFVVTSSVAGKNGVPYSSTYTASKHALHGYFEGLRSEMVEENIDVTMVCPGPVFSLLPDRCLTGKMGETYEFTQQSTDKRMETGRCSELMVTAMAHRLDECWICIQPVLLVLYLGQYMPSTFRRILLKILFNRRRVMQMRQGR